MAEIIDLARASYDQAAETASLVTSILEYMWGSPPFKGSHHCFKASEREIPKATENPIIYGLEAFWIYFLGNPWEPSPEQVGALEAAVSLKLEFWCRKEKDGEWSSSTFSTGLQLTAWGLRGPGSLLNVTPLGSLDGDFVASVARAYLFIRDTSEHLSLRELVVALNREQPWKSTS